MQILRLDLKCLNKFKKKLINLRKINFSEQNISFIKFKKILNKLNIKKNHYIGGYYPINCEIGSLKILKKLEKNNSKFLYLLPEKITIWIFMNGLQKKH